MFWSLLITGSRLSWSFQFLIIVISNKVEDVAGVWIRGSDLKPSSQTKSSAYRDGGILLRGTLGDRRRSFYRSMSCVYIYIYMSTETTPRESDSSVYGSRWATKLTSGLGFLSGSEALQSFMITLIRDCVVRVLIASAGRIAWVSCQRYKVSTVAGLILHHLTDFNVHEWCASENLEMS